jgi:hypothetical protein
MIIGDPANLIGAKRGTSRALIDWLAGAIESPADSTPDF